MQELVYATMNPSKFRSMEQVLAGMDVKLHFLKEMRGNFVEAEENGKEPLINARIKAYAYYEQIQRPVFSLDSGLYFDDVAPEDQPGVHIKRKNGKAMTDIEMMHYYRDLAGKHGGRLTAYYKNAICLVMSPDKIFSYDGPDLNSERFYLVDQAHAIFKPGFPLDSLSVDIATGRFYYDMNEERNATLGLIQGFKYFFEEALNL